MRYVTHLLVVILAFVVGGCDVQNEPKAKKYRIVTIGRDSDALLLNQATGETWRITDAGWAPVPILQKTPMKKDESRIEELNAELDRRKQIYSFLIQSEVAKNIASDLERNVIKPDEARTALQKLIPQALGPLPRDVEKENWNKVLENLK